MVSSLEAIVFGPIQWCVWLVRSKSPKEMEKGGRASVTDRFYGGYGIVCPGQGIILLGLLLAGSTGHTWQVEMGWPDIHWLARDPGWAGQELEYAVGA